MLIAGGGPVRSGDAEAVHDFPAWFESRPGLQSSPLIQRQMAAHEAVLVANQAYDNHVKDGQDDQPDTVGVAEAIELIGNK
jgi:hypothetical protein